MWKAERPVFKGIAAMNETEKPSYEELARRLETAEAALRTLRHNQFDATDGNCEDLAKRLAETQAREAHIRNVLLAVRNVNQLIVKEMDPQRLIRRACANLTETLGYFNAWIALTDAMGRAAMMTASSGFDGGFETMERRFTHGEFPACMTRTLTQDDPVVVKDPLSECPDCPLAPLYAGRSGLTCRLAFEDRVYGILSVSVPAVYAHDADEQMLFKEVADDLAFALHKIDSEAYLRSLLTPRGDSDDLMITDFLTYKTLSEINRTFSRVFDVTMLLTDAKGNYIAGPDNLSHFCELVRETEKGLARCQKSDERLAQMGKDTTGPVITRCANAGLADAVLPIRIGGRHVASWLVGQFCTPEVDEEAVCRTAQEIGADEKQLVSAYTKLKQRPIEQMEKALNLLGIFAKELSEYGMNNLKLGQAVTEWRQAEERLKQNKTRLIESQRMAGMGDFTWDAVTGEITWSDGLFELLGYDKADRIDYDKVNAEIHHPDDLERVTRWLKDAISSGRRELPPNEYRIVRKDGRVLDVRTQGVIEWREGRSPMVFATVQDITEVRQARDEVNRMLRYLEFAIAQIPIPVIIAEAPDVAISHFNNAAVDLLVNVPEDVSKIPLEAHREFWPTFYPDGTSYRIEDLPLTRAVQQGEITRNAEIIVRRQDGDHWVSASAAPLMNREGQVIAGIVAFPDITEQKRAAIELWDREERLNLALEGGELGTWDWHVQTGKIQFNKRWAQMLGYALHEIKPHLSAWEEMVHPEDLPRVYDILNAHLEGKTSFYEAEFRMRQKSGDWVWIFDKGKVIERDAGGKPVRACGTHLDITERKRAEEALKKSEQEKARMLNSMLNAFVVFESVFDSDHRFVSYRFLYINDAYERITGVKNEEVKGKTVHEVWPETEPEWIRRYGDVAVTGKSQTFELYHDPTKKLYYCNVYRPFDSDEMFCVIFEDITKRRQHEEELKAYHEQLEKRVELRTAELRAANRELEAFAYSVSHDLRAPLRAITGFAEIIAQRHSESLNEEGRHYFDNILEAGNRMGELISDLLTFSRLGKDALAPEAIELSPLLENVLSDFETRRLKAGAGIHLSEALPVIQGVRTLVVQIFMNLIDNALKYRRKGVVPRIDIHGALEGDWAVVRVTDNGLGIPPEHHEKIFNIFQRLHSRDVYSGTGVGLAIVKKAAVLMGGSVGIESESGKGSVFWVRLPRAVH